MLKYLIMSLLYIVCIIRNKFTFGKWSTVAFCGSEIMIKSTMCEHRVTLLSNFQLLFRSTGNHCKCMILSICKLLNELMVLDRDVRINVMTQIKLNTKC